MGLDPRGEEEESHAGTGEPSRRLPWNPISNLKTLAFLAIARCNSCANANHLRYWAQGRVGDLTRMSVDEQCRVVAMRLRQSSVAKRG